LILLFDFAFFNKRGLLSVMEGSSLCNVFIGTLSLESPFLEARGGEKGTACSVGGLKEF